MFQPEKIIKNSDSLIDLLTAQCGDLEKLLALAREETLAAQQGNFEGILDIVSKRAEIGRRLETFQQQIAELRNKLGASATSATANSEISNRVIEIANLTLAQDQQTKLLLTGARDSAAAELNSTAVELNNLERANRGNNAYLKEQARGSSYNRNF